MSPIVAQISQSPLDQAFTWYRSVAAEIAANGANLDASKDSKIRNYYRNLLNLERRVFFEWHAAERLALFLETIRGPSRLRILDVACGMGSQALLYALLGHEVVGLDVSADDLEIASRRAEYYGRLAGKGLATTFLAKSALALVPKTAGTFDRVFILEAFSHIHPPRVFLKKLKALIRPGGQVVISDTNGDSPAIRVQLRRKLGHWSYDIRSMADPETDLPAYYAYKHVIGPRMLKAWLGQAGFQVTAVTLSGIRPPFWGNGRFFNALDPVIERIRRRWPLLSPVALSYTITGCPKRGDTSQAGPLDA